MKLKRRKIKRGRIEIIPMIDTIVILLIFYMTFSQFAEAAKANLKLPRSVAGKDENDPNNPRNKGRVIVNMSRTANGELELRLGADRVSMAELPNRLLGVKQQNKEFTDMSILLRADEKLSYVDLSDFMKACAKAKVIDVSFTTIQAKNSTPAP